MSAGHIPAVHCISFCPMLNLFRKLFQQPVKTIRNGVLSGVMSFQAMGHPTKAAPPPSRQRPLKLELGKQETFRFNQPPWLSDTSQRPTRTTRTRRQSAPPSFFASATRDGQPYSGPESFTPEWSRASPTRRVKQNNVLSMFQPFAPEQWQVTGVKSVTPFSLGDTHRVIRNIFIPTNIFTKPSQSPKVPGFIRQSHDILKNALKSLGQNRFSTINYSHHLKNELAAYSKSSLDNNTSFNVMTQREALTKAYFSNLITWKDFQSLSRDPGIDIRRYLFDSLGIYSRINSGQWDTSTGYPTFRSVFSDMDIIARDEENYRELINHLREKGYEVKPQLSNAGQEVLHTVEQLDLALWPPQSMMPVRKMHEEVTNSPAEREFFEQFPMLRAMGELAKVKLYTPDQLSKLSDSELFAYFRSSVAKPLYKFFDAINEVSQEHWVAGHPNLFPPKNLLDSYRQMVANELSPLEVLEIKNTAIPDSQHVKAVRRAMEVAILNHQKAVARYIFPYMSPMVENATQASMRAAAKRLENNPYSNLRDFLQSDPDNFGSHQGEFKALLNQHQSNISTNFSSLIRELETTASITPETLQNLMTKHLGTEAPEIIDDLQKHESITRLKEIHGSNFFNTSFSSQSFLPLISQKYHQLKSNLDELYANITANSLTSKNTQALLNLISTYDPSKEINPHLWNAAMHRRELLEIRYNDMLELLYNYRPSSGKQMPERVPAINFKGYDASLMALLSASPQHISPVTESKTNALDTFNLNTLVYKKLYDLLQQYSPNFTSDWGLNRSLFNHNRDLYQLQSKAQSILSAGNSLKQQLDTVQTNTRLSPAEKTEIVDRLKKELFDTLLKATHNKGLQELATLSTDSLRIQAGQEALQHGLNRMKQQLAIAPYQVWTDWNPQNWFDEFYQLKKNLSSLNDVTPIIQAIALTSLQHPSRQDAIQQTLHEAGISSDNPQFSAKLFELESFLNAEVLSALKPGFQNSPERNHAIIQSLLALKDVNYPPGLTKSAQEFLQQLINDPATPPSLKIHIGMLLRKHPHLNLSPQSEGV